MQRFDPMWDKMEPFPEGEWIRYADSADAVAAERERWAPVLRALLAAKWCTPEYDKACRDAASLLGPNVQFTGSRSESACNRQLGIKVMKGQAMIYIAAAVIGAATTFACAWRGLSDRVCYAVGIFSTAAIITGYLYAAI